MDPDSLDWIWQDFETTDDPKELKDEFDDVSDFPGSDDYGVSGGSDDDDDHDYDSLGSGKSDDSFESDMGYMLMVTETNAIRKPRGTVEDADKARAGAVKSDHDGEAESITVEAESISVEDLVDANHEYVDRFYIDALDEVERKISDVRLVWADALYQCTIQGKNVPESYMKTTNTEKLVLLYAQNFIEQFKIKYPNRRPLSLVLKNECDVQKCVCTTIKPSRLVYHDLNDLISYSKFVANHITYIKLEDPTIVPKKIMSPSTILETQTANCFELAILLASFLIGCEYNAFVVQGYATDSVCNNDLSRTKLDMSKYDNKPKPDESDDVDDVDEDYAVDFKLDMSSEFVKFLIDEEKKKTFVEDEVKEVENNFDRFSDPLNGRRVHCWVMIIPLEVKYEQTDIIPYFIEPSVGERKEVSNESYIGIELIWNHKNYWINLQSLGDGCTEYDFTLTNKKCWEQFLPDKNQYLQRLTMDIRHNENESSRNVIMPNSWVSVLEVPRNKYLMLYPMGKKITRYMNAFKESYAEYILADGLMERITFYAEPEYEDKIFTKESYRHRVNRLICIETRLSANEIETVEYFSSGRRDCLKMHTFFGNSSGLNTKRSFVFYTLRRDSMIELKIDQNSFITMFNDRSDLLFWRMSKFEQLENLDGRVINSKRKPECIVEKFLRDESKHKDRDIATRFFYLTLNKIRVLYQYGEGQITQSKRTFLKQNVGGKEEFDPASVTEKIVYPYEGYLKPHEKYKLLQEMLEAEVEAIRAISKLEDEVIEILENRSREQWECKLKINPLDWDRNHKIRKLFQNEKDRKLFVAKREDAEKIDYALPSLQLIKKPFTYDKVLKIRDQVVSKFQHDTYNQFIRAKNSFKKKESKMRSVTMVLETDNFKEVALKNKMVLLGSSLKSELEVLTMKMQRYKETRAERYNNLVTYLNSKLEFKILPPLKLLDSKRP